METDTLCRCGMYGYPYCGLCNAGISTTTHLDAQHDHMGLYGQIQKTLDEFQTQRTVKPYAADFLSSLGRAGCTRDVLYRLLIAILYDEDD